MRLPSPCGKAILIPRWRSAMVTPGQLCQLTTLAIENRHLGFEKVKYLVADRFQRDVLADLEFRLSWVNTVIKSAPDGRAFGNGNGK